MLIKNTPERVTRRRALAYYRKHGKFPDSALNIEAQKPDTKIRRGRNSRMKVALKFE